MPLQYNNRSCKRIEYKLKLDEKEIRNICRRAEKGEAFRNKWKLTGTYQYYFFIFNLPYSQTSMSNGSWLYRSIENSPLAKFS